VLLSSVAAPPTHILAQRDPIRSRPHRRRDKQDTSPLTPVRVKLGQKAPGRGPEAFLSREFGLYIGNSRADERTRTADLLSLIVVMRALQGFAQSCESAISKQVSFSCLASCCTVLRSRWCQSGVKRRWIKRRPFLLKQIRDRCSITLFTEALGRCVLRRSHSPGPTLMSIPTEIGSPRELL
jgi:hypothetical protein